MYAMCLCISWRTQPGNQFFKSVFILPGCGGSNKSCQAWTEAIFPAPLKKFKLMTFLFPQKHSVTDQLSFCLCPSCCHYRKVSLQDFPIFSLGKQHNNCALVCSSLVIIANTIWSKPFKDSRITWK